MNDCRLVVVMNMFMYWLKLHKVMGYDPDLIKFSGLVSWLFREYTHLLSLSKDVKLGFNTVLNGNKTPGRRVAVHLFTAAPRSTKVQTININIVFEANLCCGLKTEVEKSAQQ